MRAPRLDEPRSKPCEHCGQTFGLEKCANNIAKFRTRRYCSTSCSAKANRPSGDQHPMWKPDLLEKQRTSRGPQAAWAKQVKKRDGWTCVSCKKQGGRLEAHHIDEFSKVVELRWDLENGITLCLDCHRDVHAGIRVVIKNAVNSVELCRPVRSTDNTEPSLSGNALEGVTTRERAYGTWEGNCGWCGNLFQRWQSQVRGKAVVYCCNSCAASARMQARLHGSNVPTSPAHRKVKI